MALKDPSLEFPQQAEEIDALIQKRISGKLKVLPVPYPPLLCHVGWDFFHCTSLGTSKCRKARRHRRVSRALTGEPLGLGNVCCS